MHILRDFIGRDKEAGLEAKTLKHSNTWQGLAMMTSHDLIKCLFLYNLCIVWIIRKWTLAKCMPHLAKNINNTLKQMGSFHTSLIDSKRV